MLYYFEIIPLNKLSNNKLLTLCYITHLTASITQFKPNNHPFTTYFPPPPDNITRLTTITHFATVQAPNQIQIRRVRDSTMNDQHSIVDDCAQRQPTVYLVDQLQQTFCIVLRNQKKMRKYIYIYV